MWKWCHAFIRLTNWASNVSNANMKIYKEKTLQEYQVFDFRVTAKRFHKFPRKINQYIVEQAYIWV